MKQILQNISNGETSIVDIPSPKNIPGSLLISTSNSLISAGTERMLIEFGKANYLQKARQQPDKVREVIDKVRTDGVFSTYEAIKSKLDQPIPLGYCNAGVVINSMVEGFSSGDRVISNGNHAEIVRVPKNLCAKIPDEVDDESAAFTVIGSISLQGIRLTNPTLGETVVVSGLGLVGLISVQMLLANGCRVLGIDYDSERCALAKSFGAEIVDLSKDQDPLEICSSFTSSHGADAVIITASTESNELIHEAAQMCRKRGRIVLVGVTGLNLNRDDFFEKELTFQVSASYGPGRYDSNYEENGNDYPIGFVRWTEQRNFEAVLEMMRSGSLNLKSLVTHRYSIEDGLKAYKALEESSSLAILIDYKDKVKNAEGTRTISLKKLKSNLQTGNNIPNIAVIGAGNHASRTLIPALKKTKGNLHTLYSSGGVSGFHHGIKAGFQNTSTDIDEIWSSKEIDTVVVATRHDNHAELVVKALDNGKNIFVEKPLALTLGQLKNIDDAVQKYKEDKGADPILMVGFNRRFSPHVIKMRSLLQQKKEPKSIIMTVNAGFLPKEHWLNNPEIGGGRIIGEGCHFIDLMMSLIGKPIIAHQSVAIGSNLYSKNQNDNVAINLSFEDGSIGTIHYLSNGGASFPKERIEVFCGGSVLQIKNYITLKGYNWKGFNKLRSFKQDKGQAACAKSFIDAIINNNHSPIDYSEIKETSRLAIEISNSLK